MEVGGCNVVDVVENLAVEVAANRSAVLEEEAGRTEADQVEEVLVAVDVIRKAATKCKELVSETTQTQTIRTRQTYRWWKALWIRNGRGRTCGSHR